MKSRLPIFLIVLFGIISFLNPACNQQQSPQPPNILLILADDMGYSDLGCYGSEINTPNLDQLAADGMMFTQFYNTAKCVPTRTEIMTGLYHQQTDELKIDNNNVTIAEVLKENGYFTAMCGKWHLGRYRQEKDTPPDRGFNRFFGFLGGGINYYTGVDDPSGDNLMRLDREVYEVPDDFYSTDDFTDYGLEFMKESREHDKPFFLYMSYNAPHFPLQVPEEEIEKYLDTYSAGWDNIRYKRYQKMIKMNIIDPAWKLTERDSIVPAWEDLSEDEQAEEVRLMATYAGMIDRMDQQIGRLLQYLDDEGMTENTLVMFLSDNGACPFDFNHTPNIPPGPANSFRTYDTEWANASNTPFRLYKQWIHEGGISTPMIVCWPGKVTAGSMLDITGRITDLMPTILEAAGAAYPESYNGYPVLPAEGESLLPVFEGKEMNRTKPFFWEYRGSRGVRDGDWKLVAERGREWELYNLKDDRSETINLIEDYAEKAEEFGDLYDEWAGRSGAPSNAEAKSMKQSSQDRYLFEEEKLEVKE